MYEKVRHSAAWHRFLVVFLRRIENAGFLLAIAASQWRNVLFDPCVFEARPSYFVFL